MKSPTIRVDNREPANLTAELTYLGYKVENMLLKAGISTHILFNSLDL